MQNTIQYIETELEAYYPKTEISGFIRIIMETVFGFSYTDFILRKDEVLDNQKKEWMEEIVNRLKNHEPIQYILGETEFFHLKLAVNPAVLIPRPETEELVHWIVNSGISANARILDIGTGSGCIALALKNEMPGVEVCGVDVSEEALKTAVQNAGRNKLEVEFQRADILKWQDRQWPKFDLVVSNPPYVRQLEKRQMDKNVLRYEPDGALYVDDKAPLVFYEAIAAFARENLNEGGWLFFEINEYLGKEMQTLVRELGFSEIELRKDINGRDRMLSCKR